MDMGPAAIRVGLNSRKLGIWYVVTAEEKECLASAMLSQKLGTVKKKGGGLGP
jgi:hypothetical protein